MHQPPSRSNRATLFFLALVFLHKDDSLFIGGSPALEDWRYQRQAVQAQAVATGKTLRQATANTDTLYEISYRFALADGKPYEQTERTSVHLWEQVERGSPLVAEYLPGQHESARVVQDRPDRKRRISWAEHWRGSDTHRPLLFKKAGAIFGRQGSTLHKNTCPRWPERPSNRRSGPFDRSVGIWLWHIPARRVPGCRNGFLFYNDGCLREAPVPHRGWC